MAKKDDDDNVRHLPTGKNGTEVEDAAEGQSLEDLEESGATGEEDDGQFFVWEEGRKVTLGTLIGRGTTVEHAFVFGGKRQKGRGSLVGLDEDVFLVARGRVEKTVVVPTRDDQERVTKVTIETHIASKVVVNADSDEAMGMLAGILDKRRPAAA